MRKTTGAAIAVATAFHTVGVTSRMPVGQGAAPHHNQTIFKVCQLPWHQITVYIKKTKLNRSPADTRNRLPETDK